MSGDRMFLARGRWYGWQMLPGYTDGYDPYFSPIRILHVEALKTGHGILRVDFWNALYAEGAQQLQTDLKIRSHHAAYLVAELRYPNNGPADRSVVISAMSAGWLERFCPLLVPGPRADTADGGDIELHLDLLFPG
jgi:hypothetical protein